MIILPGKMIGVCLCVAPFLKQAHVLPVETPMISTRRASQQFFVVLEEVYLAVYSVLNLND